MTLSEYMNKYNISAIKLGQELGVSRQTIYNWLRGEEATYNQLWNNRYIPSAKMMYEIYEYTGRRVKPASFYPLK
ncbi:helix-turn-helix transcriptional regulator [Hyphomonas sp.]|jgi:transcriptional regulator with XRE-family HTH domain|uniref:helix-turn-helix domain-containing protein n=1 Tax=Hyphomonas sp. TaxID=87 RepID=UPI000C9750A0|nr:helix-turn-helix transcriptional regulator [Hyphomonas sp.]MAL44581.1 hypothetical protein [Hyphomonas sp.]|tara:strand:+ start:4803 stop:5027 length:225 start_codon:yes stop_codon:yes gene_type:complete